MNIAKARFGPWIVVSGCTDSMSLALSLVEDQWLIPLFIWILPSSTLSEVKQIGTEWLWADAEQQANYTTIPVSFHFLPLGIIECIRGQNVKKIPGVWNHHEKAPADQHLHGCRIHGGYWVIIRWHAECLKWDAHPYIYNWINQMPMIITLEISCSWDYLSEIWHSGPYNQTHPVPEE